jgi:hypothetical protein
VRLDTQIYIPVHHHSAGVNHLLDGIREEIISTKKPSPFNTTRDMPMPFKKLNSITIPEEGADEMIIIAEPLNERCSFSIGSRSLALLSTLPVDS